MAIQLSIETINEPFNIDHYREVGDQQALAGRTLLSIGVGVMVLDTNDNMLVLHHEAREGQWQQGAVGPSMETVRFTKETEDSDLGPTESPMQAWQRSLNEELGMSPQDVYDAGFYFSRDSLVADGEWNLGAIGGYPNSYAGGLSMVLRVSDPDAIRRAFSRAGGRTEEINKFSFSPIDKVYGFPIVRPGFLQWLTEIELKRSNIDRHTSPLILIDPVDMPTFYGADIRFGD
jgi:hypothetical protein